MGTFQRSSALRVAPASPHTPDLASIDSSLEPIDDAAPFEGVEGAAGREFRIFDRSLAAFLLLVGSPLFLAVGFVVLVADGRPIFYRGTRLGRGRARFDIWKFRTLRRGAQAQVGGRVLSAKDRLEIPFGKALRSCRLDELPQLINIVRGEMNFWGPRPERPEVYLEQCVQLDGYDRRFRVSPGLIGVSQLFTPHKTPKRLRVRLDNGTLSEPPSTLRQIRIIGYTMLCTLRTLLSSTVAWLKEDLVSHRLLGRDRRRRALKRVTPPGAVFDPIPTAIAGALASDSTSAPGDQFELSPSHEVFKADEASIAQGRESFEVVDLNESHCRVRYFGTSPLPSTGRAHLRLRVRRNGRLRVQSARCNVALEATRPGSRADEFVFAYDPDGCYSEYVLHQYFLKNSLATPARFVGKRRSLRRSASRVSGPIEASSRPLEERSR